MEYNILVKQVDAEPVAAVRARLATREIPARFMQSLDKVWDFLGRQPHLRSGGHNVFLYHHDMDTDGAMTIDFGVQVARRFEAEGDVFCAVTPAGEVATTMHRGPYTRLKSAHDAVHTWIRNNGRSDGGWSWEIYGDWNEDPQRLETQIFYLLG
jgi:effector-binding domain-containing protein